MHLCGYQFVTCSFQKNGRLELLLSTVYGLCSQAYKKILQEHITEIGKAVNVSQIVAGDYNCVFIMMIDRDLTSNNTLTNVEEDLFNTIMLQTCWNLGTRVMSLYRWKVKTWLLNSEMIGYFIIYPFKILFPTLILKF